MIGKATVNIREELKKRIIKKVIFSDVIDRNVTSNPYKDVSSGAYEDAVMSVGDTNSFHRFRPSITPD